MTNSRKDVAIVRFLVSIGMLLGAAGLVQPYVAAQDAASTPGVGAGASSVPAASPAATAALAEFVAEIRLGADPLSSPVSVAVDTAGTLYVIDALKNEIRVLAADGSPVATLGEAGSGPGQFAFRGENAGWGDLAFGPDGNLYVLDPFNSRIQVLAPDGAFVREWGESGTGPGQFFEPHGIAVDGGGRVYVADSDNQRVQVFDAAGSLVGELTVPPSAGEPFRSPDDIAVDVAGVVYVTDSRTNRIYRFDASGAFIDAFGEQGQLLGPWGLAVDEGGRLYVAESTGNRLQVFAADGSPLGIIGGVGVQPGQFIGPHYLALGPDGLLYVADLGNRRIQVFRLSSTESEGGGTPRP
jgi:DNA-binding beta-propeller fold protein YncE